MEEKDRWKNRRRMAWLAMWGGLLFPLLVFVADSTQLTAIATPFYIFAGTVVGAYIGFVVADDKWQKAKEKEEQ